MATRSQCDAAVKKLHKDAVLEHESINDNWDTHITAPQGHHWDQGRVHSRVVHWYKMVGNKGEYWTEVLEEIHLLGEPVKCTQECCDEWDTGFERNVCGYWDE